MFYSFFHFYTKVQVLISLFAFLQFHSVVCWDGKVHKFSGFWGGGLQSLFLVIWLRLGDPFVSQNPREFCASHSPLVRMVKFKFLAQFPVNNLAHTVMSTFILSLYWFTAFSYFVIDFFYLYHHITYIRYFVTSYLFFTWYSWSLWHCSVLLSGETQFLSKGFRFLAISKFSWVRFRFFFFFFFFVAWSVHRVVFLLTFIFWLFLFCWCLCCLYCVWWL